ncbi:nucleotidyltransferase family protein [Hydrogenophaga crocea]|uniref:NTP transferase domain-containing protein n=1 Tax=Hydrogenophaga crocea TaxID=2716225 RepID=A0A6G8IDM1_9BURK|nr:NTP transferase domain-containing protein [Hydrogenophaga crocea]QIM51294.1 NTP transferase domain-containing protein [Hydrogenophaga crocea]
MTTTALILAAGAGQRLGSIPKCLVRLGGRTLLQRLLESLQALPAVNTVLVVGGPHGAAILRHLNTLPRALWPLVVRNPQPGDDPSDSLHTGLRHLTAMPDRLLVLLADLPLLDASALQAALDAFDRRERGLHALVPTVNGQPGHPVVLDEIACATLRGRGHGGLRAWRRDQPDAVAAWPTDNPRHVRDLDTPDDLERLAQDTGLPVSLPSTEAPPPSGAVIG